MTTNPTWLIREYVLQQWPELGIGFAEHMEKQLIWGLKNESIIDFNISLLNEFTEMMNNKKEKS